MPLTALADIRPLGRPLALLTFGATLLFALHTARAPDRVRRLAWLLVGTATAAGVAAHIWGSDRLAQQIAGMAMALLAITSIWVIGRRLLQHAVVGPPTVLGALCIYVLLGLCFAFVFGLTSAVEGPPFFSSGITARPVDYLYFSFTTLTTVGYGDLAARGDAGRLLAVTEALLGQLYLVTVVALLVGNVGQHRRRDS